MIGIFIYNILLIVLYTIAMSFTINFYFKTKENLFLYLTIYLTFFIFDNIIIYMTEFINSFAVSYNQTFMSIPTVKTIIFIVNAITSLLIITSLAKEKVTVGQWIIVTLLGLWMLMIPFFPNSALKIWFYYLPNQLFLFYLGCYLNVKNRQKETSLKYSHYLKQISFLFIFASIAIVLEDTFVIFNLDHYTSLALKINNRNVCEDLFSILVCLMILRFFFFDSEKTTAPIEEFEEQKEQKRINSFLDHYQFTQREAEIFLLLLEHKSNQEIADKLYLSIGTVKTHVHNIFIKLNIKKREQIFIQYEEFQLNDSQ
ncbi:response regulator transcription factor [Enterococcus sp. LJL99]